MSCSYQTHLVRAMSTRFRYTYRWSMYDYAERFKSHSHPRNFVNTVNGVATMAAAATTTPNDFRHVDTIIWDATLLLLPQCSYRLIFVAPIKCQTSIQFDYMHPHTHAHNRNQLTRSQANWQMTLLILAHIIIIDSGVLFLRIVLYGIITSAGLF